MADSLDEVFGMDDAAEVVEPVVDIAPEPELVEAPQEPEPEPVVEQEQPQPSKDWVVPGAAMLEERERAKALERELNDLKAQRQQPAQQANVPDPYDQPNEFAAHIEGQIAQARQAQKVDTSYHLAVRDYGKDQVEEARTWALEKAQSDPVFMQQVEVAFQTQALPIDWVIQQHKRDGLVSQIGDRSLDDFVKDYITKNPTLLGQTAPATAPAAVVPTSASAPRVPRSLASQATAPSDVRQTATGPLVGVDALFG